jgi:hypothetical protein
MRKICYSEFSGLSKKKENRVFLQFFAAWQIQACSLFILRLARFVSFSPFLTSLSFLVLSQPALSGLRCGLGRRRPRSMIVALFLCIPFCQSAHVRSPWPI